MVELGDEAVDTVSGFKGVVIGITKWLNGCTRVTIQPKCGKDGKLPESGCFDEPQLKVTKPIKRPEPDRSKGGPLSCKISRGQEAKR